MGASKRLKSFWDIYSWWYDSLLTFEPYREMVRDIINSADIKKGHAVLDIGCGTGILTKEIRECGAEVVGLDNSFYMLKRAHSKINDGATNMTFLRGDINRPLSFKDNVFDRVYASNVISYSENPAFTLSEMYRVLKKEGIAVITNPHKRFNLLKLLFFHFKKKGLLKTLIVLYPLIMLGLMNIAIFKNVKSGKYSFFDKGDIYKVLFEANFQILRLIPTYGKQAFLVLAKKGL